MEENIKLKTSAGRVYPNYALLIAGVFLLLVPLVFLVFQPDLYDRAQFFLRVIAALGGGLVGASLPGILDVTLPYAKAGGAMAVFLLIYGVNPPKEAVEAFAPEVPQQASVAETQELALLSGRERPGLIVSRDSSVERVASLTNRELATTVSQPALADAIDEPSWREVMAISWVKPRDWLGRQYHLRIDQGLYLWPTELNEQSREATVIVNSSDQGRQKGNRYLDQVSIKLGESIEFEANEKIYSLELLSIRNAGLRPSPAGYFQAYVRER